MQFIDVTTDFAFKKVFGSQQSKDILISFLNALLNFGNHPIVNLTIVDPYQAPLVATLKNTFVDIKAYLDNGTQVIIEMQVLNQAGFDKRVLSNVAKAYITQLEKGDKYTELNPAIGLTVTDFVMFPQKQLESQVITDYTFLERHHKVPYPEEMRLVFVELPKFEKKLRQLKGMADKWIYFVKNVGSMKSLPKTLANDKDINQALTIANTTSLTLKELELQEKKLRWLREQKDNLARAEQAEADLEAALEKAKAEKQAVLEKAKAEKQAALKNAEAEKQAVLEKAKAEKQAALKNAEAEKQAVLEKAKAEKQTALKNAEAEKQQVEAEKQQVEAEKQAALKKAKNAEKAAKLQIAKQMLQAHADIAFIRQVTGLKKVEITKLKE
ncbi:Rpn family recombination-promoting nuclease/putative transposase [Candidatus Parabeggiatoa sp. HSG14]|uniref:Rpn family recombination-promoting nuclease/putative transposase n=1 Tax=Candidatus Parabeggiatoa sp. HSG14 TaxID=3055593 RepID=UPI0025A84CDC|nr:Rpn family recombination-promoting nuclease/putative transposase [Thiotrichales bacterium HSG14]